MRLNGGIATNRHRLIPFPYGSTTSGKENSMAKANDWEMLQQIKRLVADCFDGWDRWKWSNNHERDYTLVILEQTYRAIRSPAFRERAVQEIAQHGRLHVAFLRKLGIYIDF